MALDPNDPGFSFMQYGGFEETSEASERYNCIALAAGDPENWWWPDGLNLYYWPPGIPRNGTLECFITVFRSLGYECCEHPGLEDGFEKIAIFTIGGKPKHVAHQTVTGQYRGKWISKMGTEIDIAHELNAVSGPAYGAVTVLMRHPLRGGAV